MNNTREPQSAGGRTYAADILKTGIIISTIYALWRLWHWKIGFTYFTQLSNIFVAVIVLLQMITRSPRLCPLKFAATVSILVTFLVFLLVLAPMDPGGLPAAYGQDHCASLCLHLITPVLAIIDFFVSDRDYPWERKHVLYSLVPPLAYFAFILALGALGFCWKGMTAPYHFLNYGAPCGWFGYMPETAGIYTTGVGVFYVILAMILAILALGALLLLLMKLLQKTKNPGQPPA